MFPDQDRIHRVLDGELSPEVLTAEERRRLDELESTLGEVASFLGGVEAPDLSARVMASLPRAPEILGDPAVDDAGGAAAPPLAGGLWPSDRSSPLRQLAHWFWNPVSLAVRPAYLGMIAVAVGTVALVLPRGEVQRALPVTSVAVDSVAVEPRLYVQFRIEAPDADDVALAGSFSGWRADHHLTEIAPGVWAVMVPLTPGVHDYTFVIDGTRMVVDPYAPVVDDAFGGSNSRLFLPAPNGSA